VLHWFGFVLSILILLSTSPIAAEEGAVRGYELPPGTRWRDDANLPVWIGDSEGDDNASSGTV
jgi:hypothetical protein